MQYRRSIEKTIDGWIGKGKILIIYGPRQVGKTTLVKSILSRYGKPQDYFNCEILGVQQALQKQDPQGLYSLFGKSQFVVLDEAQKISNIGLILKIFHDTYPKVQIIATGSSSFDLSNKISEPLTGRALEFTLFPLSLQELNQSHSRLDLQGKLESLLRFGSYPEIINNSEKVAKVLLDNITSKYLFQDVLEHEQIKKSTLLINLVQLLALQIGNEVSMNELAVTLSTGRKTIERYLDLLEKAFVILRLRSFSRNLRKEIGKKQKIYFYDLGIRNSLIARYNPLHLRDDVGALWENYIIIERLKYLRYNQISSNTFFWRTHDQKEIDYVEESNGKLHGYELKWNKDTFKKPQEFLDTYMNSDVRLINKDNFYDFLLGRAKGVK
ncbi:ATPase [Candidatus Roizmanbacteria bacterium CG_4_10_14_0_8_um_filter_39_9]|uniref:ATPase n=1 Tax=Candidatus Roizmanbacteria bacterium CG_4_10_14_0_8_um_filter_39_9 TaxID=1974829 RepID=A0A2M7QBW8_9BACT|nr:MAG: ATPase [Candidatus Roizmanbacteria bacterium CG_4_10_14_0_8_um_filter_39_9]